MQFYMYLPNAEAPDQFVVTDDTHALLLRTENAGAGYAPVITNPAGDMTMLKVRYSSVFGDSFVFTDVTGNRGTYHTNVHKDVVTMHMMTGGWDVQYYKPEGTVKINKLRKRVADVTLLPDYALCFSIDLKDTSELLFVVGSLLAVSYFLR